MSYSVDIKVVKIPIFEPNSPEFAEEYSEETWHFVKLAEVYRALLKDDQTNERTHLQGPHDQTDGAALIKCLNRCILEIEAHEQRQRLCPTQ